jgi:hypothetical protein
MKAVVSRCDPFGPMAWRIVLEDGQMEELPHRYAWTARGARRKAERMLRRRIRLTSQTFEVES